MLFQELKHDIYRKISKLKWKLSCRKDEIVDFDVYSIYLGHHKVTYCGVEAIRCPFDYLIYQMIISEIKPDLVIEIGTNKGGGALYIADLMNNLGHGAVHTIDIIDAHDPLIDKHPRITTFLNGWQQYDLYEAKNASKVLVIEDSSHHYDNTMAVLQKFAEVVTPGSYLIVEDGIVNELGMTKKYDGGPLRAINEFLRNHPEFIVDKNWSNLFGHNATFNVKGYLYKQQ